MALSKFNGVAKDELAMVEIAREILVENKSQMKFSELNEKVQSYLENNDAEKMVQFYSDLNADGSFISLGNNEWGLREWYPIDSINETIHDEFDEDEATSTTKKKTAKKVNVFAEEAGDDVIDYNDDDPEDDEELDEEVDENDGNNKNQAADEQLTEISAKDINRNLDDDDEEN